MSGTGRRVLVTGGTGSVGRAIVRAFSAAGDSVTFQFHRDSDTAHLLQTTCKATAVALNLARPFRIPDPHFDVVVNCAGINVTNEPTHRVRLRDWNLTLTINVTAAFSVVKQCLPYMLKRRAGCIINISSIYGLRGIDGNLPYNVSKHALSGLTKTVAKDYAAHGIRCNEICPGPVDSALMQRIAREEGGREGIKAEEYLRRVAQEIPAGRLAVPEDIAGLAVMIADPSAAYLNGASIPLDGGLIA